MADDKTMRMVTNLDRKAVEAKLAADGAVRAAGERYTLVESKIEEA